MTESPSPDRLNAYGRRRLVQVTVMLAFYALLYFAPAGRLDLPWGWAYFAVSLLSLVVGGLYIIRRNPQVINERGRPAEGQKRWDKLFMLLYTPLVLGEFIIAGLDARFAWSAPLPVWLRLLGLLLVAFSAGLTYAAMAHNKFLSMYVQVSQQRGHQVATGGPYRWVRHPMYASFAPGYSGMAFVFGSWWALIPAGLALVMVIIRTALEDRALQAELPGYADYARQVRWRLFPGIW